MTIIRNILICIILTMVSNKSYAATNNYSDDDLLSIPSMPLDPFSEATWYVKKNYGSLEIFLDPKIPEESKLNGTFLLFTIGMNKPIYDNLLSYGLNATASLAFLDSSLLIDKAKDLWGEKFVDTLDLNKEKSTLLPLFSSIDTAFSLKASLPVFDNLAITSQGDIGVSVLCADTRNIFSDKNLNSMKAFRPGAVGALSFGIEFFPIEWVGISVNWTTRHYYFTASQSENLLDKFNNINNLEEEMQEDYYTSLLNEQEKVKKKELEEKSKEAFSISVNNILSVGVHFTF